MTNAERTGAANMNNHNLSAEAVSEAFKGAPPVAVVASSLGGFLDINFVVAMLTGLYVVLQGAYLIWKWRREARDKP